MVFGCAPFENFLELRDHLNFSLADYCVEKLTLLQGFFWRLNHLNVPHLLAWLIVTGEVCGGLIVERLEKLDSSRFRQLKSKSFLLLRLRL